MVAHLAKKGGTGKLFFSAQRITSLFPPARKINTMEIERGKSKENRMKSPKNEILVPSYKSAFQLSDLTGQTIPVVMRISLLIKTILLDQ